MVVTKKADGVSVYCSFDEIVSTASLKENPRNPNTHSESQIKLLSKIIKEQGWRNPIVVSKRSGFITKGHARLASAKLLKVKEVPIDKQDYPSDQAELADMLADNRIAELAEVRFEDVDALIKELDKAGTDLDLTGYDEEAIQSLRDAFKEGMPDITDADNEAPPVRPEAKSKIGDLYVLGNHRLLCGDATSDGDVKKLVNGKEIDMVCIDPPYGVDYSNKNEMLNKFDKGNGIQEKIKNDNIKDYRKFFCSFLSIIPMADYNTAYIFMSSKELHSLRIAFEDSGFFWSDYLVWVKNNHVLGRKDYNSKHEFVMYGWKNHHKFYGPSGTTILEFNRPLKSELHPTMKPIELLAKLITDGSRENSVVYDGFGGSGSTLIACEKTNRACYMMELDPHYVDVIIERWEKLTGQKARIQ